jgi:phage tail sheath protein FI
MTPEYKFPGVYVEEIPTHVRPIEGVPTSTEQKLAADTGWKHVPVRRFFLFLKDSIYKGINWLVHEPKEKRKKMKCVR